MCCGGGGGGGHSVYDIVIVHAGAGKLEVVNVKQRSLATKSKH